MSHGTCALPGEALPDDAVRGHVITREPMASHRDQMPRRPDATDCIFYHTMDIPGLGLVAGQWDLRGSEQDYLGAVPLADRTVLEIGPASGYLTFWMERQGARVTSFDLDANESWDIVPFATLDLAQVHAERAEHIRKINNAWWYARAALDARAACVYGSVYNIDQALGLFDVVTIQSVLLHLGHPLLALERAAARAREHIVVTDVSERQFAAGRSERALQFIPSIEAGGPFDGWWYIPSTLVEEYLKILGFASVTTQHFKAKFHDGHSWDLYTTVGTRSARA